MRKGQPTTRPTDAQVQFSVLENGLDFISTALSHLQGDPSPRDLKYAVLHLSAGIELVLKDRLRREHWSLVFGDINRADASAYQSGDFYSVSLKDCMKRLASICRVRISDAERTALLNLKGKRNRMEHFSTIDSAAAIKASSAGVLSFAVDFIANQFETEASGSAEAQFLTQIRSQLPKFVQFVESRFEVIREELLRAEVPIVECPRCVQDAMLIDEGAHCKFCGYSATGESAAADYTLSLFGMDWRYIADGGFIPTYACPECWSESFVDVGMLKEDVNSDRLICFSCGYKLDWDESGFCIRCGNPFAKREDSLAVCTDCYP